MNYKIKVAFITIIAAMLVFFISGGVMIASAEEVSDPAAQTEVTDDVQNEEPPAEVSEEVPEEPETPQTDEEIGADFVEWLKATFGSDYEYYYNQIIENWGSIEDYLTQFGEEHLPEGFNAGLQKVLDWLNEYVVIWAPVLAIVVIVAYYLIKKRSTRKTIEKVVDSKMNVLSGELNKQSKAIMAIGRGQTALLGKNARFADTVKEIEDTEKELRS